MKPFSCLFFSLVLFGCSKTTSNLAPDSLNCSVCTISPSDTFISTKAVLLAEITGLKCNNGPIADAEAANLLAQYPGKLHLVTIHAGVFAEPDTAYFTQDLRSAEGNQLYTFADPIGMPSAMVDMTNYGHDFFAQLYPAWADSIRKILTITPQAELAIAATSASNKAARNAWLTAKFKATTNLSKQTINWCAFLIEDNVVTTQKMPDGTINFAYSQNAVLRASFNGAFGTPLNSFSGKINSTACDTRQLFVDENWEWENCSIIVFAYDAKTYEVLQTVKTKL